MMSTNAPESASQLCQVCGALPPDLLVNTGRGESFPAEVGRLVRLNIDIGTDLYRCPGCDSLFEWEGLPQYYGSGNEDEERLTRLDPTQAATARMLLDPEPGERDHRELLRQAFTVLSGGLVHSILSHLVFKHERAFSGFVGPIIDELKAKNDGLLGDLVSTYCGTDRDRLAEVLRLLDGTEGPASYSAKHLRERCSERLARAGGSRVGSDPNKTFRGGDAFLLGYLQHLICAHFEAFDTLDQSRAGAEGELASRVEARLRALPERGPEIVSCVWQIQEILGKGLRVRPPAPPRSPEEGMAFSRAVESAFEGAPEAGAEGSRTAYALGVRCGRAEMLVATASLQWALWAAAPGDAHLSERGQAVREWLVRFTSSPGVTSDCPTMQSEDAAITRELRAALSVAARPPDDTSVSELAKIQARLGHCARALESAAWGTPRACVRAWRDKRLDGAELIRRLAEHYSWLVPCRVRPDGQPEPRILAFDKRALLVFSDSQALAERPAFLPTEKPEDQLCLNLAGTALFRWLPDSGVDVLVIDPTNDPHAPYTINYPREMHALLRQVADETALELAACDWSRLDPAPLRAYRFWTLVSGGEVHNLLARDYFGRPLVGLFSSEPALEAHLALATPEQAREYAQWQRMLVPGEVLFPPLAKLNMEGIVLNPSGRGRTRIFNKRTVEKLASG